MFLNHLGSSFSADRKRKRFVFRLGFSCDAQIDNGSNQEDQQYFLTNQIAPAVIVSALLQMYLFIFLRNEDWFDFRTGS